MKFKHLINEAINSEDRKLLKQFEIMMDGFDTYYKMSDDSRAYSKGSRIENNLRMQKEILVDRGLAKEADKLYQKYKKRLIGGAYEDPIFGDKIK